MLLDTRVLLWWLAGAPLSAAASAAIADPVHVSSASIWEISIKRAIGKVDVDGDLVALMGHDFEPLPIVFAHAELAGRLPNHHHDPFDRMLIAQAVLERLVLVTRDGKLGAYDVLGVSDEDPLRDCGPQPAGVRNWPSCSTLLITFRPGLR